MLKAPKKLDKHPQLSSTRLGSEEFFTPLHPELRRLKSKRDLAKAATPVIKSLEFTETKCRSNKVDDKRDAMRTVRTSLLNRGEPSESEDAMIRKTSADGCGLTFEAVDNDFRGTGTIKSRPKERQFEVISGEARLELRI